jgi:hypothetical protein
MSRYRQQQQEYLSNSTKNKNQQQHQPRHQYGENTNTNSNNIGSPQRGTYNGRMMSSFDQKKSNYQQNNNNYNYNGGGSNSNHQAPPSHYDQRHDDHHNSNYRSSSRGQQQQQQQQSYQEHRQQQSTTIPASTEDEYNIQIMKEREAEILQINQKMNTVNEIYKDLAGLIDGQQELIDQVDNQIDLANGYTKAGIDNYEEARLRHENPIMQDPFGDKLNSNTRNGGRQVSQSPKGRGRKKRSKSSHDKRRRSRSKNKSRQKEGMDCSSPLEAMPEDMQDVIKAGIQDMKELGTRLMTACTAPQTDEVNEYAYSSERRPKNEYAHRSEKLQKAQW